MRVLVATDGSPSAGLAVDLATEIAWPDGSTVRVVMAIETGTALFGGPLPAVGLIQVESIDDAIRRAAEEMVDGARLRLARPGLEVSAEVVLGRPATAIIDAAKDSGADVIIVGSRGHGMIKSMLLGSVSAEVVDHAGMPVLVARGASITRAVLAVDGSKGSQAAADALATWPIFAGSCVRVVSVSDAAAAWWTGVPIDGSPELQPIYTEAASASRAHAEQLARDTTADLRRAGLEAEADCRSGDPATELLTAARTSSADLIVIGTRGRSGLAGVILGSVARNVLHHAACSVLVVRDAEHR